MGRPLGRPLNDCNPLGVGGVCWVSARPATYDRLQPTRARPDDQTREGRADLRPTAADTGTARRPDAGRAGAGVSVPEGLPTTYPRLGGWTGTGRGRRARGGATYLRLGGWTGTGRGRRARGAGRAGRVGGHDITEPLQLQPIVAFIILDVPLRGGGMTPVILYGGGAQSGYKCKLTLQM